MMYCPAQSIVLYVCASRVLSSIDEAILRTARVGALCHKCEWISDRTDCDFVSLVLMLERPCSINFLSALRCVNCTLALLWLSLAFVFLP